MLPCYLKRDLTFLIRKFYIQASGIYPQLGKHGLVRVWHQPLLIWRLSPVWEWRAYGRLGRGNKCGKVCENAFFDSWVRWIKSGNRDLGIAIIIFFPMVAFFPQLPLLGFRDPNLPKDKELVDYSHFPKSALVLTLPTKWLLLCGFQRLEDLTYVWICCGSTKKREWSCLNLFCAGTPQ